MNIHDIPRVDLGFFPTPVHRLERLSEQFPGVELWMKRDDQTGLATGGNKVRKLEYLLADALAQGATTVVTGGGIQSNFARQAAAGCAQLGLHCVLALGGGYASTDDYTLGGNVLLDKLLGAEVRVYPGLSTPAAISRATAELVAESRPAYVIPMGGSNALGSLGYVRAMEELADQWTGEPPESMVVAAGSCGTIAGILAGLSEVGWPTRVVGMCVDEPVSPTRATLDALLDEVLALTGISGHPAYDLNDDTRGKGYGIPSDEMRDAVSLLARTEGILLDPVYTGKTFAGLLSMVRQGTLSGRIVFWHTGGTPALFAYRDTFE